NHGVEIDMWVEEGEDQRRRQRDGKPRLALGGGRQPARLESAGEGHRAIGGEEYPAAERDPEEKQRRCPDQTAEAGDPPGDEDDVGKGEKRGDSETVTAGQALPQDEGVLRADGDDQPGAEEEALERRSDERRLAHAVTGAIRSGPSFRVESRRA